MKQLLLGDCLERLKDIEDNSIDSIVTDAPYGLSFMGNKWDYDVPSQEIFEECLRVLKPGGHLLCFGGSRTYHRMAVRIEDAGFEIRDQLMWIYGSGFPKSHNIGKNVDKKLGNERQETDYIAPDGRKRWGGNSFSVGEEPDGRGINKRTKGNSEYEGWGTALKPAHEPIVMARKPLSKKTVVDNVLEWGTGGINIDESRIKYQDNENINFDRPRLRNKEGTDWILTQAMDYTNPDYKEYNQEGRWPANVILSHHEDCKLIGYDEETMIGGNNGKSGFVDGYESGDFTKKTLPVPIWDCVDGCAVKSLNEHTGPLKGDSPNRKPRNGGHREKYVGTDNNEKKNDVISDKTFTDSHLGASKFFYVAKPSKKEKDFGMTNEINNQSVKFVKGGLKCEICNKWKNSGSPCKCDEPQFIEQPFNSTPNKNNHPTVKPIKLMEYLVKLVTPKGGTTLDPFMGSGTTGIAALNNGFNFIGIEMSYDYMEISKQRIKAWTEPKQTKLDL